MGTSAKKVCESPLKMPSDYKDFRLDKKKKNKWVKALLSGKYVQGAGRLIKESDEGTKHCCLGVAMSEGLCLYVANTKDGHKAFVSEDFLPLDIQEMLAAANDSGTRNFKRIANWIKKNL